MPEFTFITENTRIIAKDRHEALKLCHDGQVPLSATVIQHELNRDLRYPISHNEELYDAACRAHNMMPAPRTRLPVFGLVALPFVIFSVFVAGAFFLETIQVLTGESKKSDWVEPSLYGLRWTGLGAAFAVFFLVELKTKKRATSPEFVQERWRIEKAIQVGVTLQQADAFLSPDYSGGGKTGGVDSSGFPDIVNYTGKIAEVRLTARDEQITKIKIKPKYGS